MHKFYLITLLTACLAVTKAPACTNFLLTKGATKDGSTMITYAADSHVLYGELYHWPAGTWAEGTMMDIYEWDTGKYMGQIPQASQTYNVIGNMNEFQLAIGETTYGGLEELASQSGAIMDYGSLIYTTLQRAKTAREAIVVMTDLVAKYGYASSGESFSICDPNEVWILEMIGKGKGEKGAVWVARLVPDGYVCAHANQARITTFPLKGKDVITSDNMDKIYNKEVTTVYAKDVISFAKAKGFYPKNAKDSEFSLPGTIVLTLRNIFRTQIRATFSGLTDKDFPIHPCRFMREIISCLVGIGPSTAKLTEMPYGLSSSRIPSEKCLT